MKSSSGARRTLITGASSGIGEATARVLAEKGYRVALLARRRDELERVRRSLARPDEHLILSCDLSNPSALDAAFDQLARAFGGLDLLVNNAGIGYRAKIEELDRAQVKRLLDTNVVAVFFVSRAALPLLQRGVAPVVVNVASVVGRRGIPGQSVYSASKAAVCSFGEALRLEWAEHDIAVCTLDPALTATNFFEAQANPKKLAKPDLSYAATAEDVAKAILALDRSPKPERVLSFKWRCLAILDLVAPRIADRIVASRIQGDWRVPRR